MKMISNKSTLIPLLGIILIFLGCAKKVSPPPYSQFIEDYSNFSQIDETNWMYQHPTRRVADYDEFFMDPVLVFPSLMSHVNDETKDQLNALSVTFSEKMTNTFENQYKIVNQVGGGVARIQIAVLNMGTYIWVPKEKEASVLKAEAALQGTKFEVNCIDSISGERIAALTSLYVGEKYLINQDLKQEKNIEIAFEEWLILLKRLLDATKSISPADRHDTVPEIKKIIVQ